MEIKQVKACVTDAWVREIPLTRKGSTKKPCIVCGGYQYYRVRVVLKKLQGEEVCNLCLKHACVRELFRMNVRVVRAGKVTKRATDVCVRCRKSAVGGIWVEGARTYMRERAALCLCCFIEQKQQRQPTMSEAHPRRNIVLLQEVLEMEEEDHAFLIEMQQAQGYATMSATVLALIREHAKQQRQK